MRNIIIGTLVGAVAVLLLAAFQRPIATPTPPDSAGTGVHPSQLRSLFGEIVRDPASPSGQECIITPTWTAPAGSNGFVITDIMLEMLSDSLEPAYLTVNGSKVLKLLTWDPNGASSSSVTKTPEWRRRKIHLISGIPVPPGAALRIGPDNDCGPESGPNRLGGFIDAGITISGYVW